MSPPLTEHEVEESQLHDEADDDEEHDDLDGDERLDGDKSASRLVPPHLCGVNEQVRSVVQVWLGRRA